MVEDVVRTLGFLTLGTRLKRIGEQVQGEATRIAGAHGVKIHASQYPFLAALDRLGPLTIGDLAGAVGITQPGATRSIGQLIRLNLVKARPGRDDQRQRIVSLTVKGRRQVDFGQREVWPWIAAAVADLCGGLSGPLLDQLAAIEDRLAEQPLDHRAGTPKRSR